MSQEYVVTIGLEIHAELKTKTKMFCNSKNDPDEKCPNVNVCPICMGHPGTLPVINKEAVKHVLKVGLAVGSVIADFAEFDRKNYFYPDIPKGYQISQYKHPLVSGGKLAGFEITRIHLEEDTARSIHEKDGCSLIDFNRAGVPLMELVTEPVIHSAADASRFAKELQLLLQYLGAGEANMEKGEMRVEANISVSSDPKKRGTKVEVKNLNSFRAVEKAISYEAERHISLLENIEKVVQETRGWNENKEETFSQRLKEYSHDYRYFPDPDLPKLKLSEVPDFAPEILKKELPELPWQKRKRYIKESKIKPEQAEIFVADYELADFFEGVLAYKPELKLDPALTANYICSDLLGYLQKNHLFELPQKFFFAELIDMVQKNIISSRGAKETLSLMLAYNKKGARELAQAHNLLQQSDEGELLKIVVKIVSENPNVAADYKAGKQAVLQFLIGQGMKASKGSANPEVLRKLFIEHMK